MKLALSCAVRSKKNIVIFSPWWEHQPDRYLVHPLPLCVWDYLHKLLNTLEHHKLREVPWTPLLVECPQLRFGGRNIKKISIRKWSLSQCWNVVQNSLIFAWINLLRIVSPSSVCKTPFHKYNPSSTTFVMFFLAPVCVFQFEGKDGQINRATHNW